MTIKDLFATLLFLTILPLGMYAQDEFPSVDPSATFITSDGEEIEDAASGQSAPLVAHFFANPTSIGNYDARYEWKIYEPGKEDEPIVHRFEENMDYTFTKSGSFYVRLYATFVLNNDTIQFPEEGEANPFQISISESKLEFPNAFSPNGDGFNDTYHAKDGYQSIISFEAAIFNRWGHKLYSWNDPSGEWDGKVNGKVVHDGVYFVVVNAKGADGRKFHIRKDINVLTGLPREKNGTTSEE